MGKRRKTYTREFKVSLVNQVETGRPLTQVARENGICANLLTRWRKEYSDDPERAFGGRGIPQKAEARINELESLVGRLNAENEFLKKAINTLGTRLQEEKKNGERRQDTP